MQSKGIWFLGEWITCVYYVQLFCFRLKAERIVPNNWKKGALFCQKAAWSHLSVRSVLLLRRGVHRTPAPLHPWCRPPAGCRLRFASQCRLWRQRSACPIATFILPESSRPLHRKVHWATQRRRQLAVGDQRALPSGHPPAFLKKSWAKNF